MTNMVKKSLLTPRQRQEIEYYLQKRPNAMSPYLRTLRGYCKDIDFEQMKKDLELMETLATLELQMGRKPGYADQPAKFSVRHKGSADQHAVLRVRQPGSADAHAKFNVKKEEP